MSQIQTQFRIRQNHSVLLFIIFNTPSSRWLCRQDAADVHFQLEEQCLDFTAKGGEAGSSVSEG